jgi:hypothetical protein
MLLRCERLEPPRSQLGQHFAFCLTGCHDRSPSDSCRNYPRAAIHPRAICCREQMQQVRNLFDLLVLKALKVANRTEAVLTAAALGLGPQLVVEGDELQHLGAGSGTDRGSPDGSAAAPVERLIATGGGRSSTQRAAGRATPLNAPCKNDAKNARQYAFESAQGPHNMRTPRAAGAAGVGRSLPMHQQLQHRASATAPSFKRGQGVIGKKPFRPNRGRGGT